VEIMPAELSPGSRNQRARTVQHGLVATCLDSCVRCDDPKANPFLLISRVIKNENEKCNDLKCVQKPT